MKTLPRLLLVLATGLIVSATTSTTEAADRPNIVLIMADDNSQ